MKKDITSSVRKLIGVRFAKYNEVFYRLDFTSRTTVKRTLVQALKLCTGRTAHRGSRGIALPFLDHGTRRGWGVSVTPRPLFTPGKDPVPIVQEAGWAPGPVWTGAENLDPPGFDPRTVKLVASRYTDWATRPTSRTTAGLDIYTAAVNACLCSPTGNSKTVSFTIGKEAIITYDLYSHNTLVVTFHLSSALFRQKHSALYMVSVTWNTRS